MEALWFATVLIFTRSVYRVAELEGGYQGTIASNQPAFMVLEGPLVILATLALAIFHPGYGLGGQWNAVGWNLRKKSSPIVMKDLKDSEGV
jgi:hypothetical protein